MAVGGPRFHDIMANPWPICQLARRPSFRPINRDKGSIFPTPFSHFFHGG